MGYALPTSMRFSASDTSILKKRFNKQSGCDSTATFTAIDQNYLRPFFTKEDKHRNSIDRAPNGKPA